MFDPEARALLLNHLRKLATREPVTAAERSLGERLMNLLGEAYRDEAMVALADELWKNSPWLFEETEAKLSEAG